MMAQSKVTEANQAQVPAEVRARFQVSPGDLVVWEETPEGELRVRFRHKHRLEELVGLAGRHPARRRHAAFDAVRDKARAQRREL